MAISVLRRQRTGPAYLMRWANALMWRLPLSAMCSGARRSKWRPGGMPRYSCLTRRPCSMRRTWRLYGSASRRIYKVMCCGRAERRLPGFGGAGALDFDRARLYEEALRKAGVVSAVGFPARHSDVVREGREYVGANKIPLALGWWWPSPAHESATPSASGLLWTDACQQVDAMRYFCGEVVRVRALTAGAGAEASGLLLQLEFVSGTVGMLTCGSYLRPAPRIELELLGEGWSLGLGPDFASLRLDERDKTTILRCLNNPAADLAAMFLQAVAAGVPNPIYPATAMPCARWEYATPPLSRPRKAAPWLLTKFCLHNISKRLTFRLGRIGG